MRTTTSHLIGFHMDMYQGFINIGETESFPGKVCVCMCVCVCVWGGGGGGGGQVLISLFMHNLGMASPLLDNCSYFKNNGNFTIASCVCIVNVVHNTPKKPPFKVGQHDALQLAMYLLAQTCNLLTLRREQGRS